MRGTPCVYSATRESRSGRKRFLSLVSKQKEQRNKGVKSQAPKPKSKPTRRKRVAPSGLESNTPIKEDNEDGNKAHQQTNESSGEPDESKVDDGSSDLLGTWNHSHMDPNFELPPSPDGLADISMSMDAEFHTTVFIDTGHINTPIPTDYDLYGHGDDDFDLFTSSTTESPLSTSESFASPSELTNQILTDLPSPCTCLGIIVIMLEELDELEQVPSTSMSVPILKISYSTIDDILASLKTQISHAAMILRCTVCYSRRENISLLIRACEMLARLAGRIVLSYQTQQHRVHTISNTFAAVYSPPLTPAASPTEFTTPTNVNPANIGLDGSGANSSSSRPDSSNAMFFGRYKTDPSEWECLLRVLIGFQLNSLTGLLSSVRKCATGNISMSQMARLRSAETMVGGLVGQLESPVPRPR